MITKADFDKLKSKKVMPSVLAAENLMLAAWDVVEKSALGVQSSIAIWQVPDLLVLHLLQKETKGWEGTCYQDMAAIKTKFEEDIANCATQAAATSSAPTHGEAGETKGTVKSLAEASNSKAIALQSHKHIKVDKLYTLKNEPAKVWKLLELTETVAKLSHRPFFADKDELKEIKFSDLRNLKEWIKDAPQLPWKRNWAKLRLIVLWLGSTKSSQAAFAH